MAILKKFGVVSEGGCTKPRHAVVVATSPTFMALSGRFLVKNATVYNAFDNATAQALHIDGYTDYVGTTVTGQTVPAVLGADLIGMTFELPWATAAAATALSSGTITATIIKSMTGERMDLQRGTATNTWTYTQFACATATTAGAVTATGARTLGTDCLICVGGSIANNSVHVMIDPMYIGVANA